MAGPRVPRRQQPRQPSQPSVLSNLQSVLLHSAPTLPVYQCDDLDSPAASYFRLSDLWQSFEAWSAYGCEVPVRIRVDGVWQEVIQCYTPHLSGMQLFGADHTRRIRATGSSGGMSSYCSEDEGEVGESVLGRGGPPSCSSSACTSSTASTASTASDSDSEEACKDSPTAAAAAAARRLARAAARGSVLAKQRALGEPGAPLFEYMEAERPHLRLPLHDQVMQLAEGRPELLSLDTRDLHPASWLAVTWVPLYRVPSVPDPAASRDLQANFLTFHSLAVPPQRLAAPPADPAAQAPLPPMLDTVGAAAVAWRTEVARQHLVAAAVAAAAQQAAAAVAAAAAEQAPDSPGGCPSGDAAALAARLIRGRLEGSGAALPLSALCLRPFAFMPYKAWGPTWVDDWNLQRQHLPMVAAAGSWVARRRVQLPDFDFMSQMYRPLPSALFHHRGGR